MDVNWYIITCFIRFTSVKSVLITIVVVDMMRIHTCKYHCRTVIIAVIFMKNNSDMIFIADKSKAAIPKSVKNNYFLLTLFNI